MIEMEMRLEALERGMRRWKLISVALGLGLITVAVVAAAPGKAPEVLRCRKLEVVSDKGTVIAARGSAKASRR